MLLLVAVVFCLISHKVPVKPTGQSHVKHSGVLVCRHIPPLEHDAN
jgi:hypothetical protein